MISLYRAPYNSAEFKSGECISVSEAQWCLDCMRSIDKYFYEKNPSLADVFFTNSGSFTVSGFNVNECRTLTVNEWRYLFGDSDIRKGKWRSGVTVCGKSNCVVLLPDNWEWGSNQDFG